MICWISALIYVADVAKGWGRAGASKGGRIHQFDYNEGRKQCFHILCVVLKMWMENVLILFQHRLWCETFRDVGRLANVSTAAENLTFSWRLAKDTLGGHGLIRVAQEVTRQRVHQVYYPVHSGHVDPSHSSKTGVVAVKLFISWAKSRANSRKKKKKRRPASWMSSQSN